MGSYESNSSVLFLPINFCKLIQISKDKIPSYSNI